MTAPSRVNLPALLSRLSRICRVFMRSALIVPTSSPQFTVRMLLFCLNDGTDGVDQLVDHGSDVEGLQRERHLPGFDLRQVEDAVDELEQMFSRRLDPLQVGDRALLALVFGLFLQELAVENDGVQRRAQLVAHAGEEIALGAGRGFRLPLRLAQLIDQAWRAARRSDAPCCAAVSRIRLAYPRVGLRQLACPNLLFEGRRAVRRVPHLRDAATNGDEEKHVFEDHPGGVLEPAPLTDDQTP